ncbi:MAG: cyclodeaminase/cyclohydrolase family protein [Chloroflexota bacterium]
MIEKPVTDFLNELSSRSSTPGGGSAAALSGAMGASLVCMVCNLTLGKEKYKDVEADVRRLLEQGESLRDALLAQLEGDIKVYGQVSAAYRLPKGTPEEKAARSQAIQVALKEATMVPLEIARLCGEVMALCLPATQKGNVAAVSDAGVGVAVAEAGQRSAALNVKINLGMIKDEDFVKEKQQLLDNYLKGKAAFKDDVLRQVEEKL